MCAEGDLEQATVSFAEETLLNHSASSLRIATEAARSTLYARFFERLQELERLYLEDLMDTEDANEGIRAFLEKRRPAWTHR